MDKVRFGVVVEDIDPDFSIRLVEKYEEKILDATFVSALAMILKSLWKISVFLSHFLMDYVQDVPHSLTNDESLLPQDILCEFLLEKISLTHPLEANNVFDLFVYILDNFPPWNPYFELYEVAKKSCNRCKIDMEYPIKRCYGMIINAGSLREAMFEKFTFEKIIQVIRIDLKMPCDKQGCEKRNYVQRMIYKPPTVFTIALKWENNETEGEIFDTTSVLQTEIDINTIYQYKGDSAVTKYRLASMVCSHEDQYNCVAYENKGWVRHVGSEEEVIGDWDGVLCKFRNLHIPPEILFFENAMQRDQLVSKVSEE
ncbi:hypothetical protein CARUB_v10022019mg [Capsella rubella]|uniref:Peptidase C19 ubiquitin carboxyl-terminal hydrolase domain-containing protein n=1 Tax=Capsella rubella TaxID=81985 RepID=R0HXE0_9BRAS|nr:hypothetical protein CARUB_v10022019mg [Capsella rubella]